MWCLRLWFDGEQGGGAAMMVELGDLRGLNGFVIL